MSGHDSQAAEVAHIDPRLEVRALPPKKRFDKPRWEVLFEGRVIGFVHEKRLPSARNTFYEAIGVFPATGEHVRLELSIDFAERCASVLAFHLDPLSSVHLPLHLRRRLLDGSRP